MRLTFEIVKKIALNFETESQIRYSRKKRIDRLKTGMKRKIL